MAKFRTGDLRHQVVIKSPNYAADTYGQEVPTWSTVATVFAAIRPKSEAETAADGTVKSVVTHEVILRVADELAAIVPSWRIEFGSRVLEIEAVTNIVERDQFYACQCKEVTT